MTTRKKASPQRSEPPIAPPGGRELVTPADAVAWLA